VPIILTGAPEGASDNRDIMAIASKNDNCVSTSSKGDDVAGTSQAEQQLKRVLFVDDEEMVLMGLRRMLRSGQKHWDLEFSLGGEAALNVCGTNSFDVVVSDMRMPGMDGLELLTEIRTRFPDTVRMMLSGYSAPQAALSAVGVAHRFLSKPCDAVELETAIERVCLLRDVLSGKEFQKIIGAIGPLPSLSETFLSLTKLVENPGTTVGQIADVVQRDPAMAAKILQLVNSAFFGPAQIVTSLRAAVSHLGMGTIRNLVLVADAFRVFTPGRNIPAGVMDELWDHSQRTAVIAGKLPVDRTIREMTVIAALLHDVGRLILASRMPEQFCKSLDLARAKNCSALEAERQVMGVSHAEIGAYLLGLWGIPYQVVDAVLSHHDPVRAAGNGFEITEAVFVADLLAHEAVREHEIANELRECDRVSLEKLGLLDRLPEFRALALSS
jgi:HD-like signal output (HDOD) protein/ActR/RegA family two-component response regulator